MGTCFVFSSERSKPVNVEGATEDSDKSCIQQDQSISQGHRGAVIGGGGDDADYEEKRNTTKTEQEVAFIDEVCAANIIFKRLNQEQRMAIIKQMYRIDCPKGTKLILQGDQQADDYYVIQDGSFDIFVDETKVRTSSKGEGFGELALLYNSPRTATVMASEDSKVFAVNRFAFRTAVRNTVEERETKIESMLKSIPEFSDFSDMKISLIQMAFVEYLFEKGEIIINQGDEADRFYLIVSGVCTYQKTLPSGGVKCGDIGLGEYFGEQALITNEKRTATIIAKTAVKTLTLSKEDFKELIGEGKSFFEKINSYCSSEAVFSNLATKEGLCNLQDLLSNTVGVLGKGAFGTVTLVVDKSTGISYALKAIKKCDVVENRQQNLVITEMRVMRLLAKLKCTFLANLVATFKDWLRVYFLLEACLGGELYTILRRKTQFCQTTARFYTACVVEAFHSMHSQNIIYRDLKPENIILDTKGYAKVTDFGFAKVVIDRTFTLCGTPNYFAPEIVTGQGHGRAADWWTLGVFTYELLVGTPPFYSDRPTEIYKKILRGKPTFPSIVTDEAKKLVTSFLNERPVKRLGMQHMGTEIIRKHSFFNNFSWQSLTEQTMEAPLKNELGSEKDLRNFRKIDLKSDNAMPVNSEDDFDAEF